MDTMVREKGPANQNEPVMKHNGIYYIIKICLKHSTYDFNTLENLLWLLSSKDPSNVQSNSSWKPLNMFDFPHAWK